MSIKNVPGLHARPRRQGHAYAHAAGNTRVIIEHFFRGNPICPLGRRQDVALTVVLLRLFAVQAALALAALLNGCADGSVSDLCVASELCQAEPPPPETIDVACDVTPSSSCESEHNAATARLALEYLAMRPASVLRVWVMGTSAPLRPSLEITVPATRRQSARSRQREREQFVDDQVRAVVTLTTGGEAPARQSPLAETLTRIAAYPAEGARTVIVVTDLRERSAIANFECGRVPPPARFEQRLADRGLLSPGSLAGVTVHFAFAVSRPLADRRCPSSIAREQAVAELWRHALARAGAARVVVSQAAPVLSSPSSSIPVTTIQEPTP